MLILLTAPTAYYATLGVLTGNAGMCAAGLAAWGIVVWAIGRR